jgi:hypothetical protein
MFPLAFKFERGHVNYLDFFIVEEIAPENQGVAASLLAAFKEC